MQTKKLVLNRETIRDLKSSDLERVGGGNPSRLICTANTLSVPGCICGPPTACICPE